MIRSISSMSATMPACAAASPCISTPSRSRASGVRRSCETPASNSARSRSICDRFASIALKRRLTATISLGPVSGNGDGVPRRDIGAFELQPPAAPDPGPGQAADTLAPVISGLRARRSRVSYRISEKAGVTVKVQRRRAGSRARFRTLGTVRRSAVQGANRLSLSRRLRAKVRRPGRYRVLIVAVDAAGNRSTPRATRLALKRR